MKSLIAFSDGSTDARQFVLRKLGALIARLLLFGSLFLMHNCERCTCDIGRPTALSEQTSLGAETHPAVVAMPPLGDVPPVF